MYSSSVEGLAGFFLLINTCDQEAETWAGNLSAHLGAVVPHEVPPCLPVSQRDGQDNLLKPWLGGKLQFLQH